MTRDSPLRISPSNLAILAVVVVYERGLDDVDAWAVLRTLLDQGQEAGRPWLAHLLIYDNSASPRAAPATKVARCTYLHNPHNGGTAAAYTAAAQLAVDLGLPWLLLLDHDTRLPIDFLSAADAAFGAAAAQPTAAALLPLVRHRDGALVSPVLVTRLGTFRPFASAKGPGPGHHISAIASGAILRVARLTELMPLPAELWLDYVDHWIFAQLHRRGLTSIVFGQVIQHDLSVLALAQLSPVRLDSVLRAEVRFHRLLGPMARLIYPWRLAWRVVRIGCVNPGLALHALKSIAGMRPGFS